jgi:excisionase family DNA binding protein
MQTNAMPSERDSRSFLSVADLGKRLGVSTRTAYNLVNDREVPVVRIRGVNRIPVGALDRWLAEREQEALDAVGGGGG